LNKYDRPAAPNVDLNVAHVKLFEQTKYRSLVLHISLKEDSDMHRHVESLYWIAHGLTGFYLECSCETTITLLSVQGNADVIQPTLDRKRLRMACHEACWIFRDVFRTVCIHHRRFTHFEKHFYAL